MALRPPALCLAALVAAAVGCGQPPRRARTPPPTGMGRLTIATQPWTRVALDGQDIGSTPLAGHLTPAGKRVLVLSVDPALCATAPTACAGAPRRVEVDVVAGQDTRVFLDLR